MNIEFRGKWDGTRESLSQREHEEDAVAFKEAGSPGELVRVLMLPQLLLLLGLYLLHGWVAGKWRISLAGILLGLASMIPHEILHALCIKGKAYIYTNLRQGMLFVYTTDSMSKGRFIFMSLLPHIVFGWIPYLIGLLFP